MPQARNIRKKRKNVLKTSSRFKRIATLSFWILFDVAFYGTILGMIAGAIYGYSVTDELINKFEGPRWKLPGKVYSNSLTLLPGQNISTINLKGRLIRLNYQQVSQKPKSQGEFIATTNFLEIFLRDFNYPREKFEGYLLRINLEGNLILSMSNVVTGKEIYTAELEPELIGRFFGEKYREERDIVTFDQVSPYLINAIVSIEDNSFFEHHGINFRGLLRSTLINIKNMRAVQGGSSITQQLVKNFYLTSVKTYTRKIKEAIMAVVLEMLYSKKDIFECYLNEVYFGHSGSVSICGVGEASKFYFGKSVINLKPQEAALLASLLKSPGIYNPRKEKGINRAKIRRDYVLSQMVETGLISKEEANKAIESEIKVQHHTPNYTIAPYFIEFLIKQLKEKYSFEILISEGFRVFTTLDVEMQFSSEKALKAGLENLEKTYPKLTDDPENLIQGAMIVMEPQTGFIRAMVGGRDFSKSQFNRVTTAKRQTGSVFKPFVYCTAFVMAEEGRFEFNPASILIDEPISISTGAGTWKPRNYGNKYAGKVTARVALEKSINIPAVKLSEMVGIENVIEIARKLGIKTMLPKFSAVALGSVDLNLLETANAYSTLASLGTRAEPISIVDVVDKENNVLSKRSVRVENAIPSGAAYLTVNIMKGVMNQGTGASARRMGFTAPAAGKTGTTNNYRDAWFVGFNPNLLAGVWVGFDNNRNLGLTGGRAALPIWTDFMKSQINESNAVDWDPPDSVVFHKIDSVNGKLAIYGCPKTIEEAFIKGMVPTEKCDEHADSIVDNFKSLFNQ